MLWIILSILRSIPLVGSLFKEGDQILYAVALRPLKNTCKIAIIGYGVGGASTAYFLRELLGSSVELHVFGDGEIGGRASVVQLAGKKYEAGACISNKKSLYISALTSKFRLRKAMLPKEKFSIFDGVSFVFQSSVSSLVTVLQLLWRYGFGIMKLQSYMHKKWRDFTSIYDMQRKGRTFDDPATMSKAMSISGDSFYHLTQISAEEHFLKELGWGNKMVDELVSGICRNIYSQNIGDITAMVGAVSIAGAEADSLYTIVGGNFQVAVKALEAAAAEVHNVHVTKVSRVVTPDTTSPSFVLNYTEDEAVSQSEYWDAVIVACPLETSDIEFEGFDTDNWTPIKKQAFHRTIANLVHGKLNPKFFGTTEHCALPQVILTTKMKNPPVNFQTIHVQHPVSFDAKETTAIEKGTTQVYRVATSEPLTEDQLNLIFSEYTDHTVVDWMAYPEYTAPENLGSFILSDGLYYVNCIEHISSAMEMSCIGAKNVSLLATDYLQKLDK